MARPCAMATEEYPSPPGTFQSSLGPVEGHVVKSPFSGEEPLRLGPSQFGQSSAQATPGAARMKVAAVTVSAKRMVVRISPSHAFTPSLSATLALQFALDLFD